MPKLKEYWIVETTGGDVFVFDNWPAAFEECTYLADRLGQTFSCTHVREVPRATES